MTQPSPYNRAFNFSNFQSANPDSPLPAGYVDEEYSRIKAVIDQIRSSLRAIQRDDAELANLSVGLDQLKPEVSIGLNPPTVWASATNYVVRDTVVNGQIFYMCEVSHVSTVFADDLAAGKWTLLADFTSAGTPAAEFVAYGNLTSGLTAINVQDAIDEMVADLTNAVVDIAGGTIDGTPIGTSSPAAGVFTSLTLPTGGTIAWGAGNTVLRQATNSLALNRLLDLSDVTANQVKFGNANNSTNNATLDGYTDWIQYTPTFTAFGTVASHSIWSKRIGDSLKIRGKFTFGNSTAAEARITLGVGGVGGGIVSSPTKVPSIQLCGDAATGSSPYKILIQSNVGHIVVSENNLAPVQGISLGGSGTAFSFFAEVPISGW